MSYNSSISRSYLHLMYLGFCLYRRDKPYKGLNTYFLLLAMYRYFGANQFTTAQFRKLTDRNLNTDHLTLRKLLKAGFITRISQGKYVISAKGIDVCLDAVKYCDENFNRLLP